MRIRILDFTLRDARTGQVTFGIGEKLLIARRLDELGVDYIDGGWPAGYPRDREFFARARDLKLQHARLAAFGWLRPTHSALANDPHIQTMLETAAPVVCLSGESWEMYVSRVLQNETSDHLAAIADTVRFLKERGREVIYNAEHFFEAYDHNPGFAVRTLEAACTGGADVLCLCDTNGTTPTTRLEQICADMRRRFDGVLGIRADGNAELAVANTLAAVGCGFTHVEGCVYPRVRNCESADLCSVLAKLDGAGHTAAGPQKLEGLKSLARSIAESPKEPRRGDEACAPAHAGGIADLPSKLIRYRLEEPLTADSRRELLDGIREKEAEGYDLTAADGTLELLMREAARRDGKSGASCFQVLSYEVATRATAASGARTTATVTIDAGGAVLSANAEGRGPLNALDLALRQCLSTVYASLGSVELTDYTVRVLEPNAGTAAKVRVTIEWSDGESVWRTAGVSHNIIEASWLALTDAVRLELMRLPEKSRQLAAAGRDDSWAV